MRSPLSFLREFSNSYELRKLFFAKNIELLARSTGLIERQRELTGSAFLHICTFFSSLGSYPTFDQMRGELLRFGIRVAKSSVSDWFDQRAVSFMKVVFESVLRLDFQSRNTSEYLGKFTDVIVVDSSVINLHSKCASEFRGSGGGASESSAKLQFSFGLLTAAIHEILLNEGVKSDSGHQFKDIVSNALYLFDLGYFSTANFRAIIEGGAFFVSRYKYGTVLYRADGRPLKKAVIDRFVRMLKPGQTLDIPVLLFQNEKIPARFVLHKLPQATGDEIRRKMRTDKQKKCKDLSAGRMAFCDVNAYITNLTAEQMPAGDLRAVYGLRWQVEIMFKTWKSGLALDEVRTVRADVFQCMLYGGLIRMLLCFRIFWRAKVNWWRRTGKELSEIKGIELLNSFIPKIREWLVTRKRKNESILSEIWFILTKTCVKEAKKGDFTPFKTITLYA